MFYLIILKQHKLFVLPIKNIIAPADYSTITGMFHYPNKNIKKFMSVMTTDFTDIFSGHILCLHITFQVMKNIICPHMVPISVLLEKLNQDPSMHMFCKKSSNSATFLLLFSID